MVSTSKSDIPSCANIQDIVWHAFNESCTAKMIQKTANSMPHIGLFCTISDEMAVWCWIFVIVWAPWEFCCLYYFVGQAYVVFKTKEAAEKVVRKLHEGCLLLANGR